MRPLGAVAILLVLLGGCDRPLGEDEDRSGFTTGFASGASGIVKVRGDGQAGRAGRPAEEPLEVAVVDDDGDGISGVTVSWSVTANGGTLSEDRTRTDSQGRTRVRLTLGPELGENQVQATARPRSGRSITLTAVFTVDATVLPVETVGFGYRPPAGTGPVEATAGDTIEFVNTDSLAHSATATAPASGDGALDTGVLAPGESRRFVPEAPGSWTVECTVHPDRTTPLRLEVR